MLNYQINRLSILEKNNDASRKPCGIPALIVISKLK